MIILDFGSGNTCQNNWPHAKKMIDELKKIDTGKHEVIIKWQLFKKAGENIPLKPDIFKKAYDYAKKLGYKTTSSVFDQESLDFLVQFEIPFIKIANNRNLDWLMGEIPRKTLVYVSVDRALRQPLDSRYLYAIDYNLYENATNNLKLMCCVSDYPTTLEKYENKFTHKMHQYCVLNHAVSDHTTDFKLWDKYHPEIVEWHYVLEHDENNLDGGLFARTPKMLSEIL